MLGEAVRRDYKDVNGKDEPLAYGSARRSGVVSPAERALLQVWGG